MRTHLLAAALAAAAFALPAHAATITIQPDVDYGRLSWVAISFNGGQNYQGELAGQLRLRRTGGDDRTVKAASDFLAFCVEPTEWLATSTLTVGALATGDTALGGMGVAKARAIARALATAFCPRSTRACRTPRVPRSRSTCGRSYARPRAITA